MLNKGVGTRGVREFLRYRLCTGALKALRSQNLGGAEARRSC